MDLRHSHENLVAGLGVSDASIDVLFFFGEKYGAGLLFRHRVSSISEGAIRTAMTTN